MEHKKPIERIAELERNQVTLLELMSLYLAHTKANSTAIAALLESFSDLPHMQERIRWHLNTASDSNLMDVPNKVYLESFERVAGFFKEAITKGPNPDGTMRAH
jgi:hypothetical protein